MSDFLHSCVSRRSTLTWWKTGATRIHWGDSPLVWVHLAHPTSAPSVRKAGAEEGEIRRMLLVRTGTSGVQDLLWALTHSQQLTFTRRPASSLQATLKPARWFPWHFCWNEESCSTISQMTTLSEHQQCLFPHLSQDTALPMQMHVVDSRWISSASVSGRKEMIRSHQEQHCWALSPYFLNHFQNSCYLFLLHFIISENAIDIFQSSWGDKDNSEEIVKKTGKRKKNMFCMLMRQSCRKR